MTKITKEIVELLTELDAKTPANAMMLMAVMHPGERRHRAVIVYATLLLGVLLTVGATADLIVQRPVEHTMLIPLLLGATMVGASLSIVVGQPNAARQLDAMATRIQQTVGAASTQLAVRED